MNFDGGGPKLASIGSGSKNGTGNKKRSATGIGGSSNAGGSSGGVVPIIIVPSTGQSALSIFNVPGLLTQGSFQTTAQAKESGVRRAARVVMTRSMAGGASRQYEIIDNARGLSKRDWARVLALFVANGKMYQFSGWPLKTPTDIFAKMCGFCVHFDGKCSASCAHTNCCIILFISCIVPIKLIV